MKTIIHVNLHKIKSNIENKTNEPPIEVNIGESYNYGKTVKILDENKKTVAEIKYRPKSPLSCGATCWIETDNTVQVID